jgi:hypothetical protein
MHSYFTTKQELHQTFPDSPFMSQTKRPRVTNERASFNKEMRSIYADSRKSPDR